MLEVMAMMSVWDIYLEDEKKECKNPYSNHEKAA